MPMSEGCSNHPFSFTSMHDWRQKERDLIVGMARKVFFIAGHEGVQRAKGYVGNL